MEATSPRFVPVSNTTYLVTVTAYGNKCPSGELYCPQTGRTVPFASLTQLLLTMDQTMDLTNYPQRSTEARTFRPSGKAAGGSSASAESDKPPLATFKINILFRQNASWQGVIIWNECSMESHFRSVLELIGLMDDALTASL